MAQTLAETLRTGSRFSSAQLHALLDHLDKLDDQSHDQKRRKTPRYVHRRPDMAVRITQPGGGSIDLKVQSRNLAATGMSFLHYGFLYNDTEVDVRLRRHQGGEDVVRGTVAWCRHLVGTCHSIGVKFKARVFPKLYVDPAMVGPVEQGEKFDPSTLHGSVLMLDDQIMDRLLFEHQIKATKINAVTVGTGAEALAKIKANHFDIVLCDLNLAEMTGEEAFRAIRAAGYKGVMIAVTAETSPQRIQGAQESGASAVIPKPYELDQLTATLAAFLADGVSSDQLIYSTMTGQAGFELVLKQYVDNVKGIGVAIKQAMEDGKFSIVRAHCQTLKGSGAGFGFGQLSDAAKDAGKVLDSTNSLAESNALVDQVVQLCRRVTSAAKAA